MRPRKKSLPPDSRAVIATPPPPPRTRFPCRQTATQRRPFLECSPIQRTYKITAISPESRPDNRSKCPKTANVTLSRTRAAQDRAINPRHSFSSSRFWRQTGKYSPGTRISLCEQTPRTSTAFTSVSETTVRSESGESLLKQYKL